MLPELIIKGKKISIPIIQGGMGIWVSLSPLASAVAQEGGLGVVSGAALDLFVTRKTGKKKNAYEATYHEISLAKEKGGYVGINVLVALAKDYEQTIKGALDAKVDAIISGAGLPLNLPIIQQPRETALIPIVSSAKALKLICIKWEKLGYRPDAVVLEGPLAGGHLGFKIDQVDLKENILENLFPSVKTVAQQYGDFPVIVAGGIYTHTDIINWITRGADGVQMGTRFLATNESSANDDYKKAVINCTEEDITIADPETNPPGSPCGLPFRVIKQAPMFQSRQIVLRCNKGYVLRKDKDGNFTVCSAKEKDTSFCICNGLIASAEHEINALPLWTVGTNAWRVNRILSVKELMDRLKGIIPEDV